MEIRSLASCVGQEFVVPAVTPSGRPLVSRVLAQGREVEVPKMDAKPPKPFGCLACLWRPEEARDPKMREGYANLLVRFTGCEISNIQFAPSDAGSQTSSRLSVSTVRHGSESNMSQQLDTKALLGTVESEGLKEAAAAALLPFVGVALDNEFVYRTRVFSTNELSQTGPAAVLASHVSNSTAVHRNSQETARESLTTNGASPSEFFIPLNEEVCIGIHDPDSLLGLHVFDKDFQSGKSHPTAAQPGDIPKPEVIIGQAVPKGCNATLIGGVLIPLCNLKPRGFYHVASVVHCAVPASHCSFLGHQKAAGEGSPLGISRKTHEPTPPFTCALKIEAFLQIQPKFRPLGEIACACSCNSLLDGIQRFNAMASDELGSIDLRFTLILLGKLKGIVWDTWAGEVFTWIEAVQSSSSWTLRLIALTLIWLPLFGRWGVAMLVASLALCGGILVSAERRKSASFAAAVHRGGPASNEEWDYGSFSPAFNAEDYHDKSPGQESVMAEIIPTLIPLSWVKLSVAFQIALCHVYIVVHRISHSFPLISAVDDVKNLEAAEEDVLRRATNMAAGGRPRQINDLKTLVLAEVLEAIIAWGLSVLIRGKFLTMLGLMYCLRISFIGRQFHKLLRSCIRFGMLMRRGSSIEVEDFLPASE